MHPPELIPRDKMAALVKLLAEAKLGDETTPILGWDFSFRWMLVALPEKKSQPGLRQSLTS